jgi:hypothetical protein
MDLHSFPYPRPFYLQYELSINQTIVSVYAYNPLIATFTTAMKWSQNFNTLIIQSLSIVKHIKCSEISFNIYSFVSWEIIRALLPLSKSPKLLLGIFIHRPIIFYHILISSTKLESTHTQEGKLASQKLKHIKASTPKGY